MTFEKVYLLLWRGGASGLVGMLQCVAVWRSVLQCVTLRCSALQSVTLRCSALQCVTLRCSALQCVTLCCSALNQSMCTCCFDGAEWARRDACGHD